MSILLVADSNFRTSVRAFAQYILQMGSESIAHNIRWVRNWDEFRQALSRDEQWERLIIYTHGAPGAFFLNHQSRLLTALPSLFTGPRLSVPRIELEGCNVGRDPNALRFFAEIFGATSISAFNYYHMTQDVDVTVPTGGSTEQQMREARRRWERYLMPNQLPPAQMGRIPGIHHLAIEWFGLERVIAPPPVLEPFAMPPPEFRTRASAGNAEYEYCFGPGASASGAQTIPGNTVQANIPFQRVTVRRTYMAVMNHELSHCRE